MSNPFAPGGQPPTLTVSQLNRQARSLLESHFDYVWVEGEVSNFAAPSSGHWYFTLKDGRAQVRCAMFRNRNQRQRLTPENGQALRLRGRVSLYEGRGEFQLIVEHLEPAGAGALQALFEELKARLLAEGLFEPARKQELPERVSRLGVITSPSGAAIHDILTVLKRRAPGIAVYLFPVPVQGEGAAAEISAAIERANRWHREGEIILDALIVGRGGGSLEDLWAFNEEVLARAIAASDLPVVSAVGHEVDFTIADMAADQRAPTPSAAAEMLSTDQRDLLQRMTQLEARLVQQTRQRLAALGSELAHLRRRLRRPDYQLREQAQRLDELEQRLLLAQRHQRAHLANRLALLETRLRGQSPQRRIRACRDQAQLLSRQLAAAMNARLERTREQLEHLASMLDSVSPLRTLERGYSVLTDTAGQVVSEAGQVRAGERLQARLARGELDLVVDAVRDEAPPTN